MMNINWQKLYNEFFSVFEESCGIITQDNLIFKSVNIHPSPDNNFAIGKKQWIKFNKNYKVKGSIHSHLYFHNDIPSKEDIKFAKKYKHESIVIITKQPIIYIYNGDGIINKIKVKHNLYHKIINLLFKIKIL